LSRASAAIWRFRRRFERKHPPLRTYHNRVARLAENDAQHGRLLREAIYGVIEERKSVRKAQVLERFSSDEPVLVTGLLRDLVTAELVFQSGSGSATAYRVARTEELPPRLPPDQERLENLLWIAIQRFGPLSLERLMKIVPANVDAARAAVDALVAGGRVKAVETSGGSAEYSSDECFIAPENPAGWEAAFFDHFQAVVSTLAARLRQVGTDPDDWVGGGTFTFEVWRGHPMFHEAVALLSETRSRARALRERIRDHNARHSPPEQDPVRVTFYVGQSLTGLEEENDHE
jgi:hypothetical protein